MKKLLNDCQNEVNDLVSLFSDTNVDFFMNHKEYIEKLIVPHVIEVCVPNQALKLLELAMENIDFALNRLNENTVRPNAIELIKANIIEYIKPYINKWATEAIEQKKQEFEKLALDN